MIPRTVPVCQTNRWQDDLNNLIRSTRELFSFLEIAPGTYTTDHSSVHLTPQGEDQRGSAREALEQFPLKVPRPFAAKMRKGDLSDPLLLQVLPQAQEMQRVPGFSADPLGETQTNTHPGLIHKYHSRVLLVVASNCAVHCRYCFRRHFPYQDNKVNRQQWHEAIAYIAQHPEVNEVIYSGGDPLSASDNQLSWLTEQIGQIEHIKRLRIHTRMPVLLPNRIDQSCLDWLGASRLKKVMVLHCNHPNELDYHTAEMVKKLQQAEITVLNQAVLLKNVNDDADTLVALSEKLFDCGVLPYYLHLLDKVDGAAHFEVPRVKARELYQQLLGKLPGFLVPRLVREEAGAASKTPVL